MSSLSVKLSEAYLILFGEAVQFGRLYIENTLSLVFDEP